MRVHKLRARAMGVARRIAGPAVMEEAHIVHRLLRHGGPGILLDVGAHRGHTLMPFAADGWTVYAFEPDPANRLALELLVAGMPNVTVVPKAVSNTTGHRTLFTSVQSTGISSLAPFTESHRAVATVEVTTLAEHMKGRRISEVTFLKVDVEGFERPVLDGFPWAHVRPRVVLVEFEDAKTLPLGYSWEDLARFLVEHRYYVLISEWFPILAYGTRHRWRGFKVYPATLIDPRGWGNLIAVDEELAPALLQAAHAHVRRLRLGRVARHLARRGE